MVKGRRCRAIFIDFLNDRRDRNTRRMPTYLFRGSMDCPGDIVINHSKWIYETDQIAPATHECSTCHSLWRFNPADDNITIETFTLISKGAGEYCCDNVPMDRLIPLRHWRWGRVQNSGNTSN